MGEVLGHRNQEVRRERVVAEGGVTLSTRPWMSVVGEDLPHPLFTGFVPSAVLLATGFHRPRKRSCLPFGSLRRPG